MKYVRKELQELDLLNNFLFGSVLTHPVYGPRLGRILLEKMLQRKVGELTVTPQKIMYGNDTNLHGICLDVQLEEALDGITVYDIETERDSRLKSVKALPRSARFYHAKMTSRGLKAGAKYGALINEIIIFITPFDPFGLKRMLYTVKNCCVEDLEMPYEDGALTLFFYTKGTVGIPSEEIHGMVEHVKHDEEVSVKYMRLWREAEEIREEALEEGRSQGIQAFVLDSIEENVSKERIIAKLVKIFALSVDEAEVYYNKYSV